jgi:hypothetical protein
MDHYLSHYLQLGPPEARDMTRNHELCVRNYSNHINLIHKHALCKGVFIEAGFVT